MRDREDVLAAAESAGDRPLQCTIGELLDIISGASEAIEGEESPDEDVVAIIAKHTGLAFDASTPILVSSDEIRTLAELLL